MLRIAEVLHGHTAGNIRCPQVLLAEPRQQVPLEQDKPHCHDGEGESSVLGPVRPEIGVGETGYQQQQKEQHVQPAAGIHPVESRERRCNGAPDGCLLGLLLPGLPVEPLRLGTTLLGTTLGSSSALTRPRPVKLGRNDGEHDEGNSETYDFACFHVGS